MSPAIAERKKDFPYPRREMTRVYHYPQIHKGLDMKDIPEDMRDFIQPMLDEIVKSQHLLARYLLKNPDFGVILEDLSNDLLIKEREIGHREITDQVKLAFPTGLPEKFKDLTISQKTLLHDLGGAHVIFYMGKRDTIRRSITPVVKEANDREGEKLWEKYKDCTTTLIDIAPDLKFNSLSEREIAAVREVKRIMNLPDYQGQDIVIVYGAGHEFENYFRGNKNIQFERLGGIEPASWKRNLEEEERCLKKFPELKLPEL